MFPRIPYTSSSIPQNLVKDLLRPAPQWMKPQLVVDPIPVTLASIGQIFVLTSLGIKIALHRSTDTTGIILLSVSLILFAIVDGMNIVTALVLLPQQWRSKALKAAGHIEKGGIILVLGCRAGAAAIPFAEETVRRGKTREIKFVCVDPFSKWHSYPYTPDAVVQTLTGAGIPLQSIVVHAINTNDDKGPLVSYDRLPFSTGSISLIISDNVLQYTRRREFVYFKEMLRVLRPGGRMIIADSRLFWGRLKKAVLASNLKDVQLEETTGLHWFDIAKPDRLGPAPAANVAEV